MENPPKLTLPAKPASPGLETQLINILKESSVSELLKAENEDLKLLLVEISVDVTMEIALLAPQMYQLKQSPAEKDLITLDFFILKAFADSLKVKNILTIPEIIETTNLII